MGTESTVALALGRALVLLDRMGKVRAEHGDTCDEASLLNEELEALWEDLDEAACNIVRANVWRAWPRGERCEAIPIGTDPRCPCMLCKRARARRYLVVCACIAHAEIARRPVPICGAPGKERGARYRCIDDNGHEGGHSFAPEEDR